MNHEIDSRKYEKVLAYLIDRYLAAYEDITDLVDIIYDSYCRINLSSLQYNSYQEAVEHAMETGIIMDTTEMAITKIMLMVTEEEVQPTEDQKEIRQEITEEVVIQLLEVLL